MCGTGDVNLLKTDTNLLGYKTFKTFKTLKTRQTFASLQVLLRENEDNSFLPGVPNFTFSVTIVAGKDGGWGGGRVGGVGGWVGCMKDLQLVNVKSREGRKQKSELQ